MLPEKAEVLFVHANGVRHMHHIATAVDHMGIEIADLTQAVTAKLQRIREHTYTVFPNIEGVLAPLVWTGIGIGHHHLRQCCPVQDGTDALLVLVGDRVEHKPFTCLKPNSESPLLPADSFPPTPKPTPLRLATL